MEDLYAKIGTVTKTVEGAVDTTDRFISPVRSTLFKRFPILATLLVSFGVAATFFGIERMITEIAWLNDRPFLIFVFGIGALIVSGKLYQKLG